MLLLAGYKSILELRQSASCISVDLAYVYELVIGVIDVNRRQMSLDNCERWVFVMNLGSRNIICGILNHPFFFFMRMFHSLDKFFLLTKRSLDELDQIYEEFSDFLEKVCFWNLHIFLTCRDNLPLQVV